METSLFNFNTQHQDRNDQSVFMSKTHSKHYVYDINKIENKLQKFELKTPSTTAYQSSQLIRQKNLNSDHIKQSLVQEPFYNIKKAILQKTESQKQSQSTTQTITRQSQLFQEKQSSLQIPQSSQSQYKNDYSQVNQSQQQLQKVGTSYSKIMHDYRQNNLQSSQKDEISQRQFRNHQSTNTRQQRQLLEPILENDKAQISILPPKSKALADPDNNIMFLDNGQRILNPTNVRTPPPPFWGEEIEEDYYDPNEDFYNHDKAIEEQKMRNTIKSKQPSNKTKRLKKKVIYVYESDSESDHENQQKENQSQRAVQIKSNRQEERMYNNSYINENYGLPKITERMNKRQSSVENSQRSNIQIQLKPQTNLFSQNKIRDNMNMIKPPIPFSQGIRSTGISSNLSQSRYIRTGAFQMLPNISINNKLT